MAATESNPIILYDITSALEDRAWSPNTWKARLSLNYKRLPYKTVWISLPDIAPTLTALGLEPLTGKGHPYTLPVISDPSPEGSGLPPTIIRDSVEIARYLDIKYPDIERPLFPAGSHALQALFIHCVQSLIPSFRDLFIPLAPAILNEEALPYYHRTRAAILGKPVDEAQLKGVALEEAWKKLEQEFGVLDSCLRANDPNLGGVGGDLVLGNQVSFADFVLVGFFAWMNRIPEAEGGFPWDRVRLWHGGRWERMWKRCEDYLEVK